MNRLFARGRRAAAVVMAAALLAASATTVLAQDDVDVTTAVHDASHADVTNGNVPLASVVHDEATVSTEGADVPSDSSFDFELWDDGSCGGGGGSMVSTENVAVSGTSPQTAESSATAALHAGDYSFKVYFTSGDTGLVDSGEAACEPFTVDKADPDVVTTIRDTADDSAVGANVPLGSDLYDEATVTGIGVTGFEPTGDVTFTFYGDNSAGNSNTGDCTDATTDDLGGDVALDGTSDPSTVDSTNSTGALHAGDFAFDASYEGDDDYNAATSDCEPVTVDPADTTTVTEVHDSAHSDVTGGWTHNPVHDSAEVDTAGYDGFDLGPDLVDSDVNVTFTIYDNGTCDGTVVGTAEDVDISGTPAKVVESSDTTLAPGYYSYEAVYEGNSDYNTSTADCEPFTVVPMVEVVRGSCTFDLNGDEPGDQFNLLYTPYTSNWKLNASNPGQLFVDIFFINPPDYDGLDDVYLDLPFPFVTQGAMPVHFYDGVTITEDNGKFCYEKGDGLGPGDVDPVTLEDYSGTPPTLNTSKATLDIDDVPLASSGLTLITVHVDFGLKWEAFDCLPQDSDPDPPTDAECDLPRYATAGDDYLIPDFQEYTFSVTVSEFATDTIESQNQFKKVSGFAGLVLSADGDPFAGTLVQVWQGTKLWKVAYADEDGWYMAQFKYTGKPTTFTVKLIELGIQRSVTLKSNGFAIVSFYGDSSEFTFIESTSTTDGTTDSDSGGSKGGGPKKK